MIHPMIGGGVPGVACGLGGWAAGRREFVGCGLVSWCDVMMYPLGGGVGCVCWLFVGFPPAGKSMSKLIPGG